MDETNEPIGCTPGGLGGDGGTGGGDAGTNPTGSHGGCCDASGAPDLGAWLLFAIAALAIASLRARRA